MSARDDYAYNGGNPAEWERQTNELCAEIDRLRSINRNLALAHNSLLVALVRQEDVAEQAWAEVERLRGAVSVESPQPAQGDRDRNVELYVHRLAYHHRAETIGQRVKRERLRRNLTQRQLADAVGVGVPHISKVEADRENPSDELLTKVADLFHVDADELMLVARRVPESIMEKLALDPGKSLLHLRQWNVES
jgi:DNA-binding XRE family transcriptional regulator